MFGTKLFDSLKDIEGVNLHNLQQTMELGNRIQQQANLSAGWTNNLGGISTAAIDVPVAKLFYEEVLNETTGVSVKFGGSKFNLAMIYGSILWDQPTTGIAGVEADILLLRINGDVSTLAYEYFVHQGFGTTAASITQAFGFSTVGASVLTGWPPSSYSDATIPATFFGTIPNANSKFQKTGTIQYDLYGAFDTPLKRGVSQLTFRYKSDKPIQSFDFSLVRTTDVSAAASGYMLPGTVFSAYGFK